ASDQGGLAADGLQLVAGDSTIRGLVFENFAAAIIGGTYANGTLTPDGGDVIQGNFIATDVTGTRPAHWRTGIELGGLPNLIGGTTPETRNLVSGNVFDPIILNGSNNQIEGNLIGTDVTGTFSLPNFNGITVEGDDNTIGGTTAAARNI